MNRHIAIAALVATVLSGCGSAPVVRPRSPDWSDPNQRERAERERRAAEAEKEAEIRRLLQSIKTRRKP